MVHQPLTIDHHSWMLKGTHAARLLWAVMLITTQIASTQDNFPLTRAERTDYRETSRYEDVVRFIEQLQNKSASLSVQFIGISEGGRRIPLVIASRPPVATPADARRTQKLIVYLQANIHGGEVEGKEAALMLLRQIAQDERNSLLDKMVLLIAPIYNIDGNETFGDARRNRPSQDGPNPVGERANGRGLDLNRDGMKAESPEMRAALRHIFTHWDPDVFMDLHTTNGTRHGYHLTYSPPLNPNTESNVLKFTRDELLPTVRRRLDKEHGLKLLDYGNVEGQGEQRGWKTFSEEPRFVTNYVGLRNRVTVLSEAASFLPFEVRVEVTLKFVQGVLDEIARRKDRVMSLTREADARVTGWGLKPQTAPALGVRFDMAARGTEPVILERRDAAPADPSKAPTTFETVKLPIFDRFRATRTARFPAAYLIPANCAKVVELLGRHGIIVEQLKQPWQGAADEFVMDELITAPTPFQGHRLNRLEGRFETVNPNVTAGDYLVRTAQPLGILIFHLLEPESLDGAAAWGFLDGWLTAKGRYPIRKTFEVMRVPTERVLPSGSTLPKSADLRPLFDKLGLKARAQGNRGTCSVFAIVGALEFALASQQGKGASLSVEFLNWAAHQAVNRRVDGGFFWQLWKGYETYGICAEEDLPYQSKFDPDLQPPAAALERARPLQSLGLKLRWIKEWDVKTGLTDAQMDDIKRTLAGGFPVCGGLRWPKREKWENGVLQVCPPEDVFDGHSILLVGYKDDATQPGGVFIIRNSGGGSREGYLPYEYVRAYMNDAAWIGRGEQLSVNE
jgi:hypothetical protein